MRQHLFKGATLAVAIAFIIVAAVAAGGGKKPDTKQQAVTPNAAKPSASADAGAGDAGADVRGIFGGTGPEYFPASKSPGGMFVRPSGSGLEGLGGPGQKKKPEAQQPAPQPAPQQAPQQ